MKNINRLFLIIFFDLILVIVSNQISFLVRLEKFFFILTIKNYFIFLLYFLLTYLIIFLLFKFKNISNRFFSIFIIWTFPPIFLQIDGYPRSIGLITFVSFLILFISSRLFATKLLNISNVINKKNIIFVGFNSNIYDYIISSNKRNSVQSIFVENNKDILGKNILGIKTREINSLVKFLSQNKIDEIIIDKKYFDNHIIKDLMLNLDNYNSKILTIDSAKSMNIDDVQQVELNDIIYRGISDLDFN